MRLGRRIRAALRDPTRARFVIAKRVSEYGWLLRERALGLVVSKTIAGITGFHPYLWYLRRIHPKQMVTPVRDFSLFVKTSDTGISPSLILYGDRETTLADTYVRLLERFDSPTIFDVGSHIGYYVVLAATNLGADCEIHAFEPAQENHDLLLRNIELNDVAGCVNVEKAAVTAERGSVELGLAHRSNSHSLRRDTGASVSVDATSLDAYCEREGIDLADVDVIRMDIEGAEAEALRGMTEIFAAGPPPVCFVEIHPKDLSEADRARILETFERHGYTVELAIAESVVSSPLPGPYDVSSFDDLASADRVHGVIAVQPGWLERSSTDSG